MPRSARDRRSSARSRRYLPAALPLEPRTLLAIVGDAGFEAVYAGPVGQYGSYVYSPAGSPWTFSNTAGIAAGGSGVAATASGFIDEGVPAPQGDQVAFLQGRGVISQAIGDWAAGSYRITFRAAQRNRYYSQDFRVTVDGAEVAQFRPLLTAHQVMTKPTWSCPGQDL